MLYRSTKFLFLSCKGSFGGDFIQTSFYSFILYKQLPEHLHVLKRSISIRYLTTLNVASISRIRASVFAVLLIVRDC